VVLPAVTARRFSTLHDFAGSPNGAYPIYSLIVENGLLYGATAWGGTYNGACVAGTFSGCGTVFEVNPQNGETQVLDSFSGSADGGYLYGGLIADGAGNLYGTALCGGNSSCERGDGVVFMVNIATRQETVLHTFSGPDGAGPTNELLRDSQGNLYGTTQFGGTARGCRELDGCGTVFRLDTAGNLSTLHNFTGKRDGLAPGGLVMDSRGNLVGSALAGGVQPCTSGPGCGTIFEIEP
jgi:uncharacterized repeat protein (TIGR03803 family)